jgi:hypothetical protein
MWELPWRPGDSESVEPRISPTLGPSQFSMPNYSSRSTNTASLQCSEMLSKCVSTNLNTKIGNPSFFWQLSTKVSNFGCYFFS